jgi:hypothetical protein
MSTHVTDDDRRRSLALAAMECESCPQNLLESLSQWEPDMLRELRDHLNVVLHEEQAFVPPF